MIIKRDLYMYLLECKPVPPETGGILGSSDRHIINNVVIDRGKGSSVREVNVYIPDVEYLNQILKVWMKKEIYFLGFFHTHAYQCQELSSADQKYAKQIIECMASFIPFLYFPLVFPGRYIKPYIAYQVNHTTIITEDVLVLV